ncbi:hypothetical protein CB1_001891001 [Camelus ferus]|nr:hypothetical protein CB1_001891001 [Camelus ferus]
MQGPMTVFTHCSGIFRSETSGSSREPDVATFGDIHCPVLIMYPSLSETRHPLEPEEQEVGIDPLSSDSSKPGGADETSLPALVADRNSSPTEAVTATP